MKKYCLHVGNYSDESFFVVDDLLNVNQLFGAMRAAVGAGYRLVNVSIDDEDE